MLSKPEVSDTEAFERCAVRANDIGVEDHSGCHEPRVVFTHAPRRPPLHQRASARMRHLKSLNREALERPDGQREVGGPLEDLFDGDNRNHEPAVSQAIHGPMSRSKAAFGRFAVEVDQE
jgi:hypothetical protein